MTCVPPGRCTGYEGCDGAREHFCRRCGMLTCACAACQCNVCPCPDHDWNEGDWSPDDG